MSKRNAILVSVLALTLLGGIAMIAMRVVTERADVQMHDRLTLARSTVVSHLRTYEQLPSVLALDSRVIRLLNPLATAEEALSVSQYLEVVRAKTAASEIFLMNQDGLTLAASNHDNTLSFVGRNYQFRPYFINALQTGRGGMFAIGATTGVPGYFMAQRIRTTGYREGVIVVKIDLEPIVERWRSAREEFFVSDNDNIIFLATRPDDLYRPLRLLEHAALFRLQASRSYERVSANFKSPLISTANGADSQSYTSGDGRLIGALPIGINGWTIHTTTSRRDLIIGAASLTLSVAFSFALFVAALVIARQRRRYHQLQQAQNRDLETKVTIRTRELRTEIDERKRAEENLHQTQAQLIQAAKLAALGKMSATIAHEVSQPLAALQTTLASANHMANGAHEGPVREKLKTAIDMTGRLNRMLKHLKTFARQGTPRTQDVSLAHTVNAALAVLDPKTRHVGVKIKNKLQSALRVKADDIQLQQVIVNIVSNAIDAVANCNRKEIMISSVQIDETVALSVRDTGEGFVNMQPSEAIEPFASSKITGEGLGLGLAITREIVERHGGRIELADHRDGGALVTVTLPAAPPNVMPPSDQVAEPAQ
ncbi:MAG: ATP-binding protein [Pseudomonadota bacterium]